MASRIAATVLSLGLNVLLARSLSQDDMGLYYISLSIACAGSLACQWGSTILAVKWIATARARDDHDGVRAAVWSILVFTILQSLVVGLGMFFVQRPLATLVIWVAWTFALALQNLVPEILRGFDDLKWASVLLGPVPSTLSLIALGSAHFAWGLLSFQQAAIYMIIANLASALLGIELVRRRAAPTRQFSSYKAFLGESTPIAFSLAASFLLSQADLWMCGYLLRHEDVAVYGVAQRFALLVATPMIILSSVVTPTFAALVSKGDWIELDRVASRGTFLTTIAAGLIYLGGVGLALPVACFFFGDKYAAAYPLFVWLGIGQVAHAAVGPNGYLLLLSGEQRAAMWSTVLAAVILALTTFIGGMNWGAQGIAAASSLTLVFQSVWTLTLVRRRMKISPQFRWNMKWRST